ncbi:MAG: efflux RND transporter periplasmic adaptor subunit [Pseudomonadota bacterium]
MSVAWRRRLIVVVILVASVFAAFGLIATAEKPEKKKTETLAPLVNVVQVQAAAQQFSVRSQGTVTPRTQSTISAELAGNIVWVSDKFVSGGTFARNEPLLRIESATYTTALEQAEAILAQRQIEYDGVVSLKDKGYRAKTELAAAKAALQSAKSDLVLARQNVGNTTIRLPFAGMLRSKQVDLGQYLTPDTPIGVVFAIDEAEVRLPLSQQELAYVDLPGISVNTPTEVELSAELGGQTRYWGASIVRTEGVVDEATRQIYAVASIDDPYNLQNDESRSALPIGTFVAARIEGKTVDQAYSVPRAVLRNDESLILVTPENTLQRVDVDVLFADSDRAFIRQGIRSGDRVVTTALESPLNGQKVRVVGDEDTASSDNTDAASESTAPATE